jgi:hypothetical protein
LHLQIGGSAVQHLPWNLKLFFSYSCSHICNIPAMPM